MSKEKNRIDPDFIRQLAELIEANSLTEIEIEQDDLRIRLAREVIMQPPMPSFAPMPPAASAPQPGPGAQAESKADSAEAEAIDPQNLIRSPMVGTAYTAPEPGADPYVKIGDSVSEGQILLIIEAMKTMNHIPSPKAGIIKDILINDAQPVEYDEPLFVIE